MKKERRNFSAEFKAKVALAAVKEVKTTSDLAKEFGLSPAVINRWKQEFISNASKVFEDSKEKQSHEAESDQLYQQIGRLKVDNDFLKKSLNRLGL